MYQLFFFSEYFTTCPVWALVFEQKNRTKNIYRFWLLEKTMIGWVSIRVFLFKWLSDSVPYDEFMGAEIFGVFLTTTTVNYIIIINLTHFFFAAHVIIFAYARCLAC